MSFTPSPAVRHSARYEDYLYRHVQKDDQPQQHFVGHSGYFDAPRTDLDPSLFTGDHLRPRVRSQILRLLYQFWRTKYTRPETWSTVWLAGSGASYQWHGDRGGVGDLDILIGVNFPVFYQQNADYRGISEAMLAEHFNKELHDGLWSQTANHGFGTGGSYEVTFFVNPGSQDIRDINPYAAYNVTADTWTVRPIELPADWNPATYFPKGWWDRTGADMRMAQALTARYHAARRQATVSTPGSPQWVNHMARLANVLDQASAVFDEIHEGRRSAFLPGGEGYLDFANMRWQAGKRSGAVDALRALRGIRSGAVKDRNLAAYGTASLGTADAMVRSSLAGTEHRF